MKKAYVIGTCDTKFRELAYVKELIEQAGVEAVLVDVGIFNHENPVDIPNHVVAACHPVNPGFLSGVEDRGFAVKAMSEALGVFLPARDDLGGVIGLGGSGGTALVTSAMRNLPIGIPKLMVSTVASGNVAPYVGPNDIAMVYSVTDIAGLNRISSRVLGNAAHAMAGMIRSTVPEVREDRPVVGMTMFGVTTPCVTQARSLLENDFDCIVFHATGTGGQSMEKLVDSGMMKKIMDITLTEICDLHMGGVMSAGEDRIGAVIRAGIPYVASVGALDMVNFGAMDTVPEKYRNRNLYVHNSQVTLMRTTPDENRAMGEWIGERLNRCEGEVRFLIPTKGVSMIDAPGKPFYDPVADECLFEAIEKTVRQTGRRKVFRLPYHINDPEFAQALVDSFREIAG